MKRVFQVFLVAFALFVFSGCGSKGLKNPNLPVTKQVNLVDFNVTYIARHTPKDGLYHTPEEIKSLIKEKVISLLEEKNLLTTDENADILNIDSSYDRVFFGDQTPIKLDKIGLPNVGYALYVYNNNETLLRTYSSDWFNPYENSFFKDLKGAFGGFTIEEEKGFIEYFSNAMANGIENLLK
ncbi:MAG: lipoprotein [Campylobacteraceae bacterium]